MSEVDPADDATVIARMERGEAPADEAEAARRAPYQRLIERVGDLDVIEPPAGWVDRAVARWESSARAGGPGRPRPLRRWAGVGAVVTVLTAALLVVWCRGGGAPRGLEVAIRDGNVTRVAGDSAAIGATLAADVPARRTELRVYRDRVLIARCPGDAGCQVVGDRLALELVMDRAGGYVVVAITGDKIPAPAAGPLALDQDAAAAADVGARFDRRPAIDVH